VYITQNRDSEGYLEVSKFTVSDRWDIARKHKEHIGGMVKIARETEKYIFSGLDYSKRGRYECSIHHEGRIMNILKIIRSASVLFILIFIPSQ
jgi:hypothetical protein